MIFVLFTMKEQLTEHVHKTRVMPSKGCGGLNDAV